MLHFPRTETNEAAGRSVDNLSPGFSINAAGGNATNLSQGFPINAAGGSADNCSLVFPIKAGGGSAAYSPAEKFINTAGGCAVDLSPRLSINAVGGSAACLAPGIHIRAQAPALYSVPACNEKDVISEQNKSCLPGGATEFSSSIATKDVLSVHDNKSKLSSSHPSELPHVTPYKLTEEYIEKTRTLDCELIFCVNENGKTVDLLDFTKDFEMKEDVNDTYPKNCRF